VTDNSILDKSDDLLSNEQRYDLGEEAGILGAKAIPNDIESTIGALYRHADYARQQGNKPPDCHERYEKGEWKMEHRKHSEQYRGYCNEPAEDTNKNDRLRKRGSWNQGELRHH